MNDFNEFQPHADMCAVMQMILPTSHLYFITVSRAPSSLRFPPQPHWQMELQHPCGAAAEEQPGGAAHWSFYSPRFHEKTLICGTPHMNHPPAARTTSQTGKKKSASVFVARRCNTIAFGNRVRRRSKATGLSLFLP